MPSLRQIRLATGLVLFAYVTLHFANHALGNISVEAMENGLVIQKLIWQSPPGAAILYLSLLTHMSLGFWALYARRHFRWTRLEATQLVARPFDSVPAGRSCDRHPRCAQPVRAREGIRAGTAQILGQLAAYRRAAGDPLADRLDSRLPRRSFLAAAQAVLSAREGAAACRSPCFCRRSRCSAIYQGGEQTLQSVQDPAWRARNMSPEHDRNRGSERRSGRRSHAYRSSSWPRRSPPTLLARGFRRWREHRVGSIRLTYPDRTIRVAARFQRARGEPHQQHPARACVRRTRPLLHLPHPRPGRPRARCPPRAPPSKRCSSGCARRPGVRLACQLRPTSDIAFVPMLSAARDDRRRLSNRSGLFGGRALCRHHVRRHARIEPARRGAPAVRHRVRHQPVPQRGEQRGLERRRRAQPDPGRRAPGAVRHGRAGRKSRAGRRSSPAPRSPPGSRR